MRRIKLSQSLLLVVSSNVHLGIFRVKWAKQAVIALEVVDTPFRGYLIQIFISHDHIFLGSS
jgi:hypothetical protein